jgi:hypothetical protein
MIYFFTSAINSVIISNDFAETSKPVSRVDYSLNLGKDLLRIDCFCHLAISVSKK